jgi:hypothetical protein
VSGETVGICRPRTLPATRGAPNWPHHQFFPSYMYRTIPSLAHPGRKRDAFKAVVVASAPFSMSLFLPGLRRVALRAPAPASICRQCLTQQRQAPLSPSVPSRILRIVRQARFQHTTSSQAPLSEVVGQVASASAPRQAAKAACPEKSSKSVAYWLLGSAASVFGIVVFGGLTRLTESGSVFLRFTFVPTASATHLPTAEDLSTTPKLLLQC